MKMIYLSTPVDDNEEMSVREAEKHCQTIAMMGYIPFSPVLFFHSLGGSEAEIYEDTAKMSVLRRCDEVWICGGDIADDTQKVVETAYALGIPVQQLESAG